MRIPLSNEQHTRISHAISSGSYGSVEQPCIIKGLDIRVYLKNSMADGGLSIDSIYVPFNSDQ